MRIIVLMLVFSFNSFSSNGEHMVTTVSGKQVLAINAALTVFNNTGLDINEYDVSITNEKDMIHVTFHVPKITESMRGSPEKTPSFEVVLSDLELNVIRSNLIR